MADISKTIEIIFGATDNGLSSSLSKFDTAIQGVAQPVGDFTKSLLKAEGAIAAIGVAMVGFAINKAGTFKESVGEIGALFNATSEQSTQLEKDILSFARNSTQSIDDINKSTFIAISTGTEWTEVTKQLAVAEQLAVAGSTDLTTATAALSRTLNAYGLDASESKRVSDALFVSMQQGDTNLTELGNAFGRLATDASGANVSLEDTLAAVSTMTLVGTSTNETMTKLKQLFIALSAPSKELAAALGDTNLETSSLQQVMIKLNEVTGGSSVKLRELIPNQEAVTAAMILSSTASNKFSDVLDKMADKTGKVEKAYAELEKSFSLINQKITNNINTVLIGIGDDLLDEYGSIGEAVVKIFDSVGVSLDKGNLSKLTKAIESFLEDVGDSLDGFANALPEALESLDFSGLLGSFSELSDEFSDAFEDIFGEGLDLSKPEDLAEALQKAVNIIKAFVNVTTGIVSQFGPIFEAIGVAASEMSGASDESEKATGKLLGALTVISEFGTAFGLILVAIKNSDLDIIRVIDVIVGSIKVLVNNVEIGFGGIAFLFAEFNALYLESLNYLTLGLDKTTSEAAASSRKLADSLREGLSVDATELGEGLQLISGELSLVSKEADKTVKSTDKLKESSVDLEKKLKTQGLTTEEAANFFWQLEESSNKAADANDKIVNSTKKLTESEKEAIKFKQELIEWNKQFPDVIEGANKALERSVEATDDLTESQKTAVKQAHELELQLNDLASNENIAAMEFTAEIKVAKFEADAKKIVAQLEAMADGLRSNNELVGDLFSHEAPNWDRFGFATESAIDDANERANDLNDSIVGMNEAQIKNLDAQTKQLAEGGSLITINADNLAPELQLVLKSLIDNIRIDAVRNGLEILT